jgi:hypothetical protein
MLFYLSKVYKQFVELGVDILTEISQILPD